MLRDLRLHSCFRSQLGMLLDTRFKLRLPSMLGSIAIHTTVILLLVLLHPATSIKFGTGSLIERSSASDHDDFGRPEETVALVELQPGSAVARGLAKPIAASKAVSTFDGDGSSLSNEELMKRIARCLPPGFKPRLHLARLIMEVSSDGVLRTPPHVEFALPYRSKSTMKAADRIVQAALLCGPYTEVATQGTITVEPDFSDVVADTQ
jgi:hypothetical protein